MKYSAFDQKLEEDPKVNRLVRESEMSSLGTDGILLSTVFS